MFKYVRILILVIIVIFAIYFDEISKYISKNYINNIQYQNYKVKIPNILSVESIYDNNKTYLYGLYPKDTIKKDKKNLKIYTLVMKNKDTLNIFLTKEKFSINEKVEFNIDKKFDLIDKIVKMQSILKYKNLVFEYLKVNKLIFINIKKNNTKITLMIGKVRDKKRFNKMLFEILDNMQ